MFNRSLAYIWDEQNKNWTHLHFIDFYKLASTKILTKNQVIEIAEIYVIEQSSSDKKIDLKKTEIDSNILEQYQTLEKVAELRHNLLNSKVFLINNGLEKLNRCF